MEGEDAKKPMSKGKKVLFIITTLLLLIGIGAGSYFLGTKSASDEPESSPKTSIEIPEEDGKEPTITSIDSPTPASGTETPTPTPNILTRIFASSAFLDGFRSSNSGGNSTLEIRAGRNVNLVTRGFVSFDISGLPAGATIEEATLRLYQGKVIGSPYSAGDSLRVDHLTYGDSLDNADYAAPALSSSFATLTSNNSIEWKDVDVTDAFRNDAANARSQSQFRIHFQVENTGGDVQGDFAYFESADNNMGTGNTPQLVVRYY
jgi:hypothetical protein